MKHYAHMLAVMVWCSATLGAAELTILPDGFRPIFANTFSYDGSLILLHEYRNSRIGVHVVSNREGEMWPLEPASGPDGQNPIPRLRTISSSGDFAVGDGRNCFCAAVWDLRNRMEPHPISPERLSVPPGMEASIAEGISDDGRVIVGRIRPGDFLGDDSAVRWVEGEPEILTTLPGFEMSWANTVSSDGRVIAGESRNSRPPDGGNTPREATVWIEDDLGQIEMIGLGQFDDRYTWAEIVSDDGSTVFGVIDRNESGQVKEAPFRWTAEEGIVPLGNLPNTHSYGVFSAASEDGSIAVGSFIPNNASPRVPNAQIPYVWDELNGVRDLRTVLTEDHGLDLSLFPVDHSWTVFGMSADATTLGGQFGNISNPTGWTIHLDRPLVVTSGVIGDFNGNAELDVQDLDLLVAELQSDRNVDLFDVNSDENVDHTDLTKWLLDAAVQDGFAEPYLPGDANLDGAINAVDLNAVGFHWLQDVALWSAGDFTADGKVNAADLNALGKNWLKELPLAAAETTAVPEPAAHVFLIVFAAFLSIQKRRKRTPCAALWLRSAAICG